MKASTVNKIRGEGCVIWKRSVGDKVQVANNLSSIIFKDLTWVNLLNIKIPQDWYGYKILGDE